MSSLVSRYRRLNSRSIGAIMALVLGLVVAGCSAPAPTATATPAPTNSPTSTSTATVTPRPTNSPTPTPGVGVASASSKWEIVITGVRQANGLKTGLDSYTPRDGYTFLVVDTSIRALTMPGSADATATSSVVKATQTAVVQAGTAAATAQATARAEISSQAAALISESGAIHTADGAVMSGMGCAGCITWSYASDSTPKEMGFVFVVTTKAAYQPYKLQFQDVPLIPFVLEPDAVTPVTPSGPATEAAVSIDAVPTLPGLPPAAKAEVGATPVALAPTAAPIRATDGQQTLQALAAATIAGHRTLTVQAAASFTKTPTPNTEQTLNAIVGLTETSQAAAKGSNPMAKHTRTPTTTATATATPTPALIAMPAPPAGMVISPANAAQVVEAAALETTERPNTVAVSPDGKMLAICGDYKLLFYDLQTLQPAGDITSGDGFIHGMTLSAAWKLLVTGGEKHIHLWDPATNAEIQTLDDGLGEFSYNFFDGPMMAVSPDGKLLAVRLGNPSQAIKVLDLPGGKVVKTFTISDAGMLTNLTFSPDGKTLAVAGAGIHVWDTSTWKAQVLDADSTATRHVIFSADGKKLAVMHDGAPQHILVWEIASGRQLATFQAANQGGAWGDMVFSPDGQIIASGNDDGTVNLWDASNGHALATLTGHTNAIRAMTFAPNGTSLITASDDHTIRLWSLPTK